mgnify:CR=1 FL=1
MREDVLAFGPGGHLVGTVCVRPSVIDQSRMLLAAADRAADPMDDGCPFSLV